MYLIEPSERIFEISKFVAQPGQSTTLDYQQHNLKGLLIDPESHQLKKFSHFCDSLLCLNSRVTQIAGSWRSHTPPQINSIGDECFKYIIITQIAI